MIVPAFFVACSVHRQLSAKRTTIDIIIVVPPGELDTSHREFAQSRGLLIDETMALDVVHDIRISEGRLSRATLMKLLLAGHFARRYDKLLYLDADLTIHGDVGGLFDLAMGHHAIAAVPSARILSDLPSEEIERIQRHLELLGMTPPYRYFNSGVMLIQPEAWNAGRLTERSLQFIRNNPELCGLPDEDSLNAVLDGDILALSPIWNARPDRLWANAFEPVIIHYAGINKPWHRFGRYKRIRDLAAAYRAYQSFVVDTPWPGFLRTQWKARDLCGSIWHEVESLAGSLNGVQSRRRRSRKADFRDEFRRYIRDSEFVDLDQGIAVRERGFIRCLSKQEVSRVQPEATRDNR